MTHPDNYQNRTFRDFNAALEAERRQLATLLQDEVMASLRLLLSQANIFERSLQTNPTGHQAKTTLFNILLSFISEQERVIIVEATTELQPQHKRVVQLESHPPNRDGKGGVTLRELLANSVKMRPDRIIVGEVQGGEVFDLMQIMNTGFDGTMTCLHANNPRDALTRLETMAILDNLSVPVLTIREMIASTIDLVVQQVRLRDGSRKIVKVSEVVGLKGDLPELADLFAFEQQGMQDGKIIGRLKPTGVQPTFLDKLKTTGIVLPPNLFGNA